MKKTHVTKVKIWSPKERERLLKSGRIESTDMYAYELALDAGVCPSCLKKMKTYIKMTNK